ncbi:UDP-glycosyltransferase UGT5-like [Microplitis mediator]|uniref:UDP-glycosyltransferase UGT5-like n=1 Tax=Microplitis mediator TaxID=375433 RepID=UPI002556A660|nr:UDP-glycosyltransferase UGT5-like [Microplitis mediator]
MELSVVYFLLFVATIIPSESYRILGIFPFQSRSHQMMFDTIIKGLLRKGHQVDVMTLYPLKNPPKNYSVVVNLEGITESYVNKWDVETAMNHGPGLPIIADVCGNKVCEFLGLPDVQKIIKNPPNNPPYDLIVMESFGANCYLGLSYILKVPVVMASSTIDLPWLDQTLGQPEYPAFRPTWFSDYSYPMTLAQRFYNTIQSHIDNARFRYYTDEVQNSLMRKYISPDIPPLHELEKNVVLALVNSFHSLTGVRPLTPGLIEVGGLHVQEHYKAMPQDLEKWMNESTAGVIYFTLGSMVNIETFPENTMLAFYSVFRKFAPVRVLMKIGNKDKLLPGLPDNVKISSWIPQVAVLAHKNTVAFITHSGLMGSLEALTYGVPMIGIPLFGDQTANIDFFIKRNMAVVLDFKNLTEQSIYTALDQVLNNPKFKKAAKYQSARFLDRPMSAVDTAVYWIEYAVRNGPDALRSPIVDMPWWQVALLDVYLLIFISLIIITCLIISILYISLSYLFSKPNTNLRKKKLHKH